MEISFRMDTVYLATIRIDRGEIVFPLLVTHVHRTFIGEQHGVTTITGRHHTIEHIDTAFDGLKDVLRCADAHQIAGLILRQDVIDHLNHLVHHFCWFSNSQTTNSVAVSSEISHMFCSILTEILIGTTLHDGEETLFIAIEWLRLTESLHTAFEPALCQSQTLLCVLVITLSWRTLVEGHHDVCSDDALRIHHVLRGKDVLRTVDMATELTTFLMEFTDACQRKYLKTSAVSQYRTIPGIELMQSACLTKDVKSWTEIEMIGITKNDLRLDLFSQFGEMDTLHTTCRTNRHEDGGLNRTMGGLYQTSSCVTGGICMLYFKCHSAAVANSSLFTLHFFTFSSFSSGMVKSSGWFTISLVRAKSHTSCTFST